MSDEYKKLTKGNINFPLYCLFFIREIQNAIDNCTIYDLTKPIEINIRTKYPYWQDAFELISKTFERKGLDIMTPTFRIELCHGVKEYIYKWKLRFWIFDEDYKYRNDLPF